MTFNRIILVLFLLLSVSCVKYSFKGALPSYLKTIYVQDFDDRTDYAGVREELMQKVTEAFIRDNSLRVIDQEKNADLILKGTILKIEKKPISFTQQEQVQEFHMEVTIKAECLNTHTQKPLWSGNITRYGSISGLALSAEIDQAISEAIDQLVDDVLTKTIAAW